jgi:predicted O-methyltransferase YrrM
VLTTNLTALSTGVQVLRDSRWSLPRLTPGGWHLSYWGNSGFISNKVSNFAHTEFNHESFKQDQHIQAAIDQGLDLYGRDNPLIRVDDIDHELMQAFGHLSSHATRVKPYHHLVEGWFDDQDFAVYQWLYQCMGDHSHMVEVGSWKGRSSACMATMIANGGKTIRFDCVDIWLGSEDHLKDGVLEDADAVAGTLLDRFRENMAPLAGYYREVRMDSLAAAQTYGDASLDVVFLDGAHDRLSVEQDCRAWLPKLRSGAVLAGHDWHHQPVKDAVVAVFGSGRARQMGNCWWYRLP